MHQIPLKKAELTPVQEEIKRKKQESEAMFLEPLHRTENYQQSLPAIPPTTNFEELLARLKVKSSENGQTDETKKVNIEDIETTRMNTPVVQYRAYPLISNPYLDLVGALIAHKTTFCNHAHSILVDEHDLPFILHHIQKMQERDDTFIFFNNQKIKIMTLLDIEIDERYLYPLQIRKDTIYSIG